MSSQPIGFFDSGLGGLSIWKEVNLLLPHESTIYIADSLNAPYGPKGNEAIIQLSKKNTDFLLALDCKMIVVACNTATTNAINVLRNTYNNVPFIGIEPAIKPAALSTTSGAIGILATKGTLSSSLFHETSKQFTKDKIVIEQVGDGIVELIEQGQLNSKKMKDLLASYTAPMLDAKIDCLVLGCTHYHFLRPLLETILPRDVRIIDSGEAVAQQAKRVLNQLHLFNTSNCTAKHVFYTNGEDTLIAETVDNSMAEIKRFET
jgi:glutamate racemase